MHPCFYFRYSIKGRDSGTTETENNQTFLLKAPSRNYIKSLVLINLFSKWFLFIYHKTWDFELFLIKFYFKATFYKLYFIEKRQETLSFENKVVKYDIFGIVKNNSFN